MRVGVIGSGMVGTALANRLLEVGHEVRMGSRTAGGPATTWAAGAGPAASAGDFADAASFGEVVVNATAGAHSLAALEQAGASALGGKVLLDVANALAAGADGAPTALTVANTDSLAEQIQRTYPAARVVKSLNTMTAEVMVHPEVVPGAHAVFLSGDDRAAKETVAGLLRAFGWADEQLVDLGDLATARAAEAYVLLWLAAFRATGEHRFNIELRRAR